MKKIFSTVSLSLVLFLLLAVSPKNIVKADFSCMTCPTGTFQMGGGYGYCSDLKPEYVTCKTGQECDHKTGCTGEASSQGNCMYCTDGNYQIGGGRGYCPNLNAIAYANCSANQACDGKKGCVDKEVPSYGSPLFTCTVCQSGDSNSCIGVIIRSETCDSNNAQRCDHAVGCVKIINTNNDTPAAPPCASITSDGKCLYVNTGFNISIGTDPQSLIQSLFGIVLSISGGIALLLIIISGYRMLSSQGNPEAIKGAREQLTAAIVGLVFIIFALVILQIIGYDILRIPAFK